MKPKVLNLFAGAGLSSYGLQQAGFDVTSVELDPDKAHLCRLLTGDCTVADVTTLTDDFIAQYDYVWASPPCQIHSVARTSGPASGPYAADLVEWSLALPNRVLWVENVLPRTGLPAWGTLYNAAQFTEEPLQNRNRVIGGRYAEPFTYRSHSYAYAHVCPTVTATEYKGCASDTRRASRFYGRKLTIEECAYHQGLQIPDSWYKPLPGFTAAAWRRNLYEGIGNGVPVYMARAFGEAYTLGKTGLKQLELFGGYIES